MKAVICYKLLKHKTSEIQKKKFLKKNHNQCLEILPHFNHLFSEIVWHAKDKVAKKIYFFNLIFLFKVNYLSVISTTENRSLKKVIWEINFSFSSNYCPRCSSFFPNDQFVNVVFSLWNINLTCEEVQVIFFLFKSHLLLDKILKK